MAKLEAMLLNASRDVEELEKRKLQVEESVSKKQAIWRMRYFERNWELRKLKWKKKAMRSLILVDVVVDDDIWKANVDFLTCAVGDITLYIVHLFALHIGGMRSIRLSVFSFLFSLSLLLMGNSCLAIFHLFYF